MSDVEDTDQTFLNETDPCASTEHQEQWLVEMRFSKNDCGGKSKRCISMQLLSTAGQCADRFRCRWQLFFQINHKISFGLCEQ